MKFQDAFPKSKTHKITSDKSTLYNCIAWAAEDNGQWWEPNRYWPATVVKDYTIEAYMAAFGELGYKECAVRAFEPGFQKIAIFSNNGVPSHAARQLPSGRWTSKLGKSNDIEHELEELEGPVYGSVAKIMRKEIAQV